MVERKTSGSFVARIWLEGDSENNPTWRGHIQHVQGKEERYFRDLCEMKEFLERISGVLLPTANKAKTDG
jgi:hypothetical protein